MDFTIEHYTQDIKCIKALLKAIEKIDPGNVIGVSVGQGDTKLRIEIEAYNTMLEFECE